MEKIRIILSWLLKKNQESMKRLIKKIAHQLGYRVQRISPATPTANPFNEMKRIFQHVDEPIIFDVGAHHGQTAGRFREIFPNSTIYSFEPFPESFDQLRQNTRNEPNTKIFNFGLSDRNGVLKFYSNPSSATNSLLSTDINGPKTWNEGLLETKKIIEAEFRTLDSVISEEHIPEVNILKLDVQGAEHLVLKGAISAIQNGQVDLIYSEIITQPTYVDQKRFDEALEVFYDCGFDLLNIFNLSLTENGRLRQVDVIFTRIK